MSPIATKPQIIIKNGRPNAVVLNIKDYERLLEALEAKNDLAELNRIKKGRISFRNIDGYVKRV